MKRVLRAKKQEPINETKFFYSTTGHPLCFFNTEALQQNDNTYQSMYTLCSIYGTDLEIILLNIKIQMRKCEDLVGFIGEGNGTPLQYSCLENPKDGGGW